MGTITELVPMPNGFGPNAIIAQFSASQGIVIQKIAEGENIRQFADGQPNAWRGTRMVPAWVGNLLGVPHLERVSNRFQDWPIILSLFQGNSHDWIGGILSRTCTQVKIALPVDKASKPMPEAIIGLDWFAQLGAIALMAFAGTVGKCLSPTMRLSSSAAKRLATVLANGRIEYLRSRHTTPPLNCMAGTVGNIIPHGGFNETS